MWAVAARLVARAGRTRAFRALAPVRGSAGVGHTLVRGMASRAASGVVLNTATRPGSARSRWALSPDAKRVEMPADKPSWEQLGLRRELKSALAEMDVHEPTPVQRMAIPAVLEGKDVICAAQTGTGKTLAYLLPVVEGLKRAEDDAGELLTRPNRPRAIVLVPSKELAGQVVSVAKQLTHHAKFSAGVLVGGKKQSPQSALLARGVDVLVATPGRLLLHRRQDKLFITDLQYVVVDEADSLFAHDFAEEIDEALASVLNLKEREGGRRVPLVCATATLTPALEAGIRSRVPDAVLAATHTLHRTVAALRHEFVHIPQHDKLADLLRVLDEAPQSADKPQTIVFCNTHASARSADYFLSERGLDVVSLHAGIPPKRRAEHFARFKAGDARVLVCTDVMARGMDTLDVGHVILYDFPRNAIDYLHRVGRASRAGTPGLVTAFVQRRDTQLANAIERAIARRLPLEDITASPSHPAARHRHKREQSARAVQRALLEREEALGAGNNKGYKGKAPRRTLRAVRSRLRHASSREKKVWASRKERAAMRQRRAQLQKGNVNRNKHIGVFKRKAQRGEE